jgi:hypothetical protein
MQARKLIGMANRSETNVLKHGGLVFKKADHHGGLIYLKISWIVVNLNMEMSFIRNVCGSVLVILYRKTLTTQGPCGTTNTFYPQGTRLFQVGQVSCITYQNAMTVRIRNNLSMPRSLMRLDSMWLIRLIRIIRMSKSILTMFAHRVS